MPDPQSQGPLTPPPDPSNGAVPDVNPSWKERILGAPGLQGQETPLSKAMNWEHQMRLSTARRSYANMKTAATELGMGDIDPQTGEPTGMHVDPQTGERRAMTPQERALRKLDYEGAKTDYHKSVGGNKDAKEQLEQHQGIFDLLVNKGHEALKAVVGAHQKIAGGGDAGSADASGGGGTSPQQTPQNLPPPPSPQGSAAASAAAPAPATGGAPAAIPPPPSPVPASGPTPGDNFRMMAPDIQQRISEGGVDARDLRTTQAKADIEETKRIAEIRAMNPFLNMEPGARTAFLEGSAPPNMTADEESVWKAGVAKAMASGKLDGLTAAANSIYKERQTQVRKTADMNEKMSEFKSTDEYRKWKEKLDVQTKKDIAAMQMNKAPAAMLQTAEFATGGLHALDDATAAMSRLEAKGVMGSLPANKVEDWIFKKGLVDPSLDAETRKDIGILRSSMELAGSAMLRAHTGRTSKEIYDDFKGMLGPGQDWSALRGAMDESRSMLSGYATSGTNENIQKLRGNSNVPPPPSPSKSASANTTKFTDNGRTYNIPNDQVSEFKKDHPNAR